MAAGITANPCIIWNGYALSICLPGGAFEARRRHALERPRHQAD